MTHMLNKARLGLAACLLVAVGLITTPTSVDACYYTPDPEPIPTPEELQKLFAIFGVDFVLTHFANQRQNNESAGAAEIFENVTVTLDARTGMVYDAALGGDGNDNTATLWIDSSNGPFAYGLGLTYNQYRVNDRYDIYSETYSADAYITYDVNENVYVGAFANVGYNDLHEATFGFGGSTTSVGGTDTYFGAGILAGYNYTYQKYSFNTSIVLASTAKTDLGDMFDEDDSLVYVSGSVYRPVTDQLAVEAYAGWSAYFDRSAGRDEGFGHAGANVIYSITDKWSASIGLESDFAQEDYEGRYLNGQLRYEF